MHSNDYEGIVRFEGWPNCKDSFCLRFTINQKEEQCQAPIAIVNIHAPVENIGPRLGGRNSFEAFRVT